MNSGRRWFHPRLISVGITCFVLLGCMNAAEGKQPTKRGTQAARLGREFNLRAQQQVTLKGESLRIKFVEVTNDSRCPRDVTCVWAGNAAVHLDVSFRGRRRQSLTLNTTGNSPADYRGYKITLVGVSPYPRSSGSIAPDQYVVTLLVSKS